MPHRGGSISIRVRGSTVSTTRPRPRRAPSFAGSQNDEPTSMTSESELRTVLETALVGRYSIERELGRGGMGTVVLARDLALDRLVAIKVLPPELAVREELRERFLRETRTAASFSHPNIVPVHAVEEHGQLLYFVMGYIEGETLGQRVKRQGPLPI